ncbi:MAG: hypothetical protein AB7I50_02515 [Vicinamibacterales bacterium]
MANTWRMLHWVCMAPGKPHPAVELSLDPDPVIEAYKKDVDRTLIRENLKLTPEQRLINLQTFVNALDEWRGAGRKRL